jgi:histidinol phosphatase-like PHP family hydrolase
VVGGLGATLVQTSARSFQSVHRHQKKECLGEKTVNILLSRREVLAAGASCVCGAACGHTTASTASAGETAGDYPFGSPLVDYHVHLDGSTVDKVLQLSTERNVKFGIVEHAGTRENMYPVVLSNDDELRAYLAMLEGKPVFKGIQAEWTDWMGCFSREVLEQLDYVLTDTMTWPGKDGKRQKMWESGFDAGDPTTFMDRYVDWYVEIMEREPIDILGNVSWLPRPFNADYDALWTKERVARVVGTAVKHRIAIEISSGFRLPKLPFLKQAKAAGVKFAFGTNGRYPKMGLLEYSLQTARELGLTQADLFTPAPDGQKAVQRRL